ncbi:MAG: LytR-cpsA-psr domain-containing protein [Lachnoclostridium sp.]
MKEQKFDKEGRNDSTQDESKINKQSEEAYDITSWVDEQRNEIPDGQEIVIHSEDEVLESISRQLGLHVQKELRWQEEIKKSKKKNFPRGIKIALISLATIICLLLVFLLTPFGRDFLWKSATNYAYGKMNYDQGLDVKIQDVKDDVEEDVKLLPKVTDTPVKWETQPQDGARKEDGVINILLLGEEAIDSGNSRGRTDLMIIATMNTKEKTCKLTSLMRDMLVQIPGYKDNKLNAAYQIGGIPLLYKTIEQNFDLKPDGYMLVDFNNFEGIINKLGGVKITLTPEEASYLNTTNYISKPEYRNVKAGTQILNGNQALGYCRIRYVATGDKQLNDFGRTSRQRVVLNAIFEQYKSKSLPELAMLLNDILPLITTDIEKEDFETYLRTALSMGLSEIQNLRIPADQTFEEGYVRKMSVLIPDIQENTKILHEFIFGSVRKETGPFTHFKETRK